MPFFKSLLVQHLSLAKLGGWTPAKRPPGKKLLAKGLAVLLHYLQVSTLTQDAHAKLALNQLMDDLFPS